MSPERQVLSRFVAEARSGARDRRSEAKKDLSPEGLGSGIYNRGGDGMV